MRTLVYFIFLVSILISPAQAGEPKTFVTKGVGRIIGADGIFTYGTKEKDIVIPDYINVANSKWQGLTYDSTEGGWTKCRVPLEHGKSLVFDCKPTS